MKKIIMTAALALASFGAFAAGTSTSNNTMNVFVPQVLSVVAVPTAQSLYLPASSLNSATTTALTDMVYTVKSNATYNMSVDYVLTITPTNNPSTAELTASATAFKNAIQFRLNGAGSWYSGTQLDAVAPFNVNNQPHTDFDGNDVTLNAQVANLGMNAVPGKYSNVITVTVTQP
jgi:hypothetical protein